MLRVLCLLGIHKPDYASMQTVDNGFSADCVWCDANLIKRGRRQWRKHMRAKGHQA